MALYLSLLAISAYLYIYKNLKHLGKHMVSIFCLRNINQNFLYTKKFWYIRHLSTLVSSHINIPHGLVSVFFMYVCWYLMNSFIKVATNMHSVTCALQTGAVDICGICRKKSVSNSQKKHQFHISFASEPPDKYKLGQLTCKFIP